MFVYRVGNVYRDVVDEKEAERRSKDGDDVHRVLVPKGESKEISEVALQVAGEKGDDKHSQNSSLKHEDQAAKNHKWVHL